MPDNWKMMLWSYRLFGRFVTLVIKSFVSKIEEFCLEIKRAITFRWTIVLACYGITLFAIALWLEKIRTNYLLWLDNCEIADLELWGIWKKLDLMCEENQKNSRNCLMKQVTNGKPGYTWENIKPIIHLSLIVMSIGRNAIR